jgi:fimbrial isopeptide formation D2 family protein/LPXTG-motif cell wall-anchored protein
MMKKTIKKLLAALLAVAMVCAMAIPAFAYNIKEDINKDHSFEAFQIFKGDVEGNKISNATWGSNINPDNFLPQLKGADTIGPLFANANSARDVLEVISQWHNSDANSIAFARFVCHYLYPTADANPTHAAIGNHTLHFDDAGYYLIVDTTYFKPGDSYVAYNSFMLTVTQANWNVDVTPKVEKPSVKKEVYDNQDGTSNEAGFGSSADHAINEEFKFKLTATLPASNVHVYDYYDKYTVIFNDTLSEGITFDRLDTVEITNGTTSQVIDSNKYTLYEKQPYLTLGIDDVKTCASGLNLNDGATITVTYTAHLNDKAFVNTTSGSSTENKNSVQLQYSNNPKDSEAYWGFTPESEVRVYTYQLNNTKYRDDDTQGNELAGAGFRLYSDKDCTEEQEIKLKKNTTDGTYSPYFGTGAGDEMFSDEHGQFNVKGLDAGTYYLRETKTPDGYSACADKKIVISATHTEYNVSLSGESNLNNKIINKKAGGITLPSTGGIGTTLFYVVGGGLMVAAIVLLVTKKRMENK